MSYLKCWWVCAGYPGFMPGLAIRVRSGRSCNNQPDVLILGEITCPLIPGDAIKCMVSSRASYLHGHQILPALIVDPPLPCPLH